MLKSSLAVVAGIIGGSAVIWLLEMLGHVIFPTPEGLDLTNPEAIRQHMYSIPLGSFIVVLIAYAAGSFTGGWIAVAIGEKVRDAVIVGIVLLTFGIINLVMIPHPTWFMVVDVLLYVPFAYVGGLTKAGCRLIS